MSDFENQTNEEQPEISAEVREIYRRIEQAANYIMGEDIYQDNQLMLLKEMKEGIRKCPEVIDINNAIETLLSTTEHVMTSTLDIEDKVDISIQRECSEIIKTIIKNASEENVSFAVGSVFECIDRCSESTVHQVSLMDTLNYAMDMNPEIANEFADRILALTERNIVRASNDCDKYYKEMTKQSVALLQKVVNYGVNEEKEEITQTAFTGLSGLVAKINPQMVIKARRDIFNQVARPVIDCIKDQPEYYEQEVKDNIFESIHQFQFNDKSMRNRAKMKNDVEKVTIQFDNAFSGAIRRNLRSAIKNK